MSDTEKNQNKEERIDRLEKEIQKLKNNKNKSENNLDTKEKISRRSFLKKLGLGAAGLGALSLSPTSALDLKDDDFNVYTGTSSSNVTEYFSVNQNGPVQIKNTDLEIKGETAATQNYADNAYTNTDARKAVKGNINVTKLLGNNGTSGQILQTDGANLTWTNISSGATIDQEVNTYNDLPLPASQREPYYVKEEAEVVIPLGTDLDFWRSTFRETKVVAGNFNNEQIVYSNPNEYLKIYYPGSEIAIRTGRRGEAPVTGDFDGDGNSEIIFTDVEDSNKLKIYDPVEDITETVVDGGFGLASGNLDDDGTGSDEIIYEDDNNYNTIRAIDPNGGEEWGTLDGRDPIPGNFGTYGNNQWIAYIRSSDDSIHLLNTNDTTDRETGVETGNLYAAGDFDGDNTDEILYEDHNFNRSPQYYLATYDYEDDNTELMYGGEVYKAISGNFLSGGSGDEIALIDSSTYEIIIYDGIDHSQTNTGLTARNLAAGDFDNDGLDEIAFRKSNNDLKIYDPADGSTTDTKTQAHKVSAGKLRN